MFVRMRSIALALIYLMLVASTVTFLLLSRTKVGPYIYASMHPLALPAYLATLLYVIATIIVLKGRSRLKISFLIVFSVLSCLFLVMVLDAGYGWDIWGVLGTSRRVYDNVLYDAYGYPPRFYFFSSWDILGKIYRMCEEVLQYSISVIFARTFSVDIYYVHLLLGPVLWGMFIPVISYSVAKALCKEERAALLAGLLVAASASLITWGAAGTNPQSMGYIFFFFTLYSLLMYLTRSQSIFPAMISTAASFLSSFLTGIVSFSVLFLAFAFRNYHTMKRRRLASAQLILMFIVSTSLLPLVYYFLRYFYAVSINFSLSKLQALSTFDAFYALVFSPYQELSLKQSLISGGLIDFVGLIGLVKYGVFGHRKVDKEPSRFLLLVFFVIALDIRILLWFMVGVPSLRLGPVISLIAVPLFAIIISNLIGSFTSSKKTQKLSLGLDVAETKFSHLKFNVRKSVVVIIFVFSLFGMVAASVYNAYAGMAIGVSGYELDAARFIDETTLGRYVVVSDKRFALAGYAVVGTRNPRAFYPSLYDYPHVFQLYTRMLENPSPTIMMEAAGLNGADFGYFVVPIRSAQGSATLKDAVSKASMYFEQYGVFGDGENYQVYIFRYALPPTPSTSDVSAFYWKNPPSYIIQNDLIKVLIPANKTLEVRDLRGTLYEGVVFNKTLVDDSPIGKLMRLEYFDSTGAWVNWDVSSDINFTFALKQQFRFGLIFEKVALVGVVERGKPFTQLRWESLDEVPHNVTSYLMTSGYERFSISGLTSSENPGSVQSRKYGPYYTVSRTEGVSLHYAYNYDSYGNSIYPVRYKEYTKFTATSGYFYYDVYVDNDADFAQWAFLEMYLPDKISGGSTPPFFSSTDNGETWSHVYPTGYSGEPLKTVNGTEVNWMFSGAAQWAPKPKKWISYLNVAGGMYNLPADFIDSGGCWNRIIFGMYLLGDTNPSTETFWGSDEGDQVLVRIGVSIYGSPLEATYVFKDSTDENYGLQMMNDVFLVFTPAGGGVTFTKKPSALNITATKADKVDHAVFDVPSNATFSLWSGRFTELAAPESLAQLTYTFSETEDSISLAAIVVSANDWDRPAVATICVPSDRRHEGGELLFERGFSHVLRAEVTNQTTQTITIYSE